MTVIAAWVGDGETFMASDSMSNCNGARYLSPRKVWRHKAGDEEVLLGFAGTVDINTRVRLGLSIDDLPDDNERDVWQWADSIAAAVWELVTGREGREDLRSDQEVRKVDYNGLLAWRGHLFHLSEWGNAEPEQRRYAAIGSGEDVAVGAMFALAEVDIPSAARVARAVTAACEHTITCGGDIIIERLEHA